MTSRTDATDQTVATERSRWDAWGTRRPHPRVLHLDSAAAGRQSIATLERTAAHARQEAETGAYVAEEEARPAIAKGRAAIAGLLGVPVDGVAFVEGASAAAAALLSVWPLHPGDTIAVTPTEWGPNLEAFLARDLRILELAVEDDGRLDLEALERQLSTAPPAVVHLTQVTSHRGVLQPVAAAVAICRAAGVPLWVDAAQAIGHVDTATGADVIYATSRKWLTGPRGVGVLGVAERHWEALHIHRSAMFAADLAPVRRLDSHDAHVAGRLGLANAVAEYLADGPERIQARLAEVGRLTREVFADCRGWTADRGGVGAVTALWPTAEQDVAGTRARLLAEHAILTTACAPARAPRDMAAPLLRVSPHVDVTGADLERLRAALSE